MVGGHHRPGVTDTLLSVTFTKKEDIFLLHLSNYISPLYNPVNPFGAISDSISPTFYNLQQQPADLPHSFITTYTFGATKTSPSLSEVGKMLPSSRNKRSIQATRELHGGD